MSAEIISFKSAFNCSLKDVDKKARIMVGAYTAYENVDSDEDIGTKGMFLKTWSENFGRIKHLLNHDVTKPIGKPLELWEDDTNAFYKSQVGTHKLGDDVLDMADSGLLTEHSYGYKTLRQQKEARGNRLLEVKLWEFSSLTGWGANEMTPLISFTKDSPEFKKATHKIIERHKALSKFCHNTSASDETIELLLLEHKQLTQIILDLQKSATAPVIITTLPANEVKSAIKDTIKSLLNSN